jgi:hypothetical protein
MAPKSGKKPAATKAPAEGTASKTPKATKTPKVGKDGKPVKRRAKRTEVRQKKINFIKIQFVCQYVIRN